MTLDELKKELAGEYSPVQVNEILEALRLVYTGQEKSDTIGIPHADLDDLYKTKIDILIERELVYTVPHAGVWDFGYRCTETGGAIAKELLKKYLDENLDDIKRYLDRYPKKLLSWYFSMAFNKTDSGHLTSRVAQLSFKYAVQELIKSWDILEISEGIRRKLLNLGVAVESFDRKITVVAPEFAEFLEKYSAVEGKERDDYRIFKALHDFAGRRITQRDELLEALKKANFKEEELVRLLKEMNELGLTSEYVDYSIKENKAKEPFEVLDYNGYIEYIHERFAMTFKDSLLAE